MTNALTIIRREHHSIESVLRASSYFVDQTWLGKAAPENKVFRAMLQVSDLFAEPLHHPKEDCHLFRLLRLQLSTHQTDELLHLLEARHHSRVDQHGTCTQGFIHSARLTCQSQVLDDRQ